MEIIMVVIEQSEIGQIPILTVVQSKQKTAQLKTVIFYHGFHGEKDSGLQLAYRLANKGFRVVLPDSDLHGERKGDISERNKMLSFWQIVVKNIKELEIIKTYLLAEKLSIPEEIGLVGVSMGGITTFGALARYDWIKSAVVLMGAPNMTEFAKAMVDAFNKENEEQISEEQLAETIALVEPYDLTLQKEKLQERPLLIWHGDIDKVVPRAFSESFYQVIKLDYQDDKAVKYVLEKGRAHNVSRLATAETVAWFKENL